MKFSEMPYTRPDIEKVKSELATLTERLRAAGDFETAKKVFLEKEELERHVNTLGTLAYIRHTINTEDPFYDGEMRFWNTAEPELEEYLQLWTRTMLESSLRDEFEREYGGLMFLNAEIRLKTFCPEIIEELQKENDLTREYEKLLASAQIPFQGGIYTISQLSPFKNDPDDDVRLAAWKAEGQWYKDHMDRMDGIYDELVHLRHEMSRKLGNENYIPLGYCRMGRNCYTQKDVEKFRLAVRKHLVPVAERIFREQAKRLGKEYPMSFADNALEFRSGNPRPVGTPAELLAQGTSLYNELSPETGAFWHIMMENELLDVLSTKGKAGGGYCTSIPDYRVPFIFANFNGTQHDVEVITHEAGHAFADYMNRDRVPRCYSGPTLEGCEVHSMSMEFMAWPWAEGFFGPDAAKFRYCHLSGALTFIPYGTAVDHFQHVVFEHPEYTPAERHGVWKDLLGMYMPWIRLDGEIPFYAEGYGWQRQHHIYSRPFYYIDYCLAQTVALQIWALLQKDRDLAWERYMAYTKQGGSRVFTELLASAGLESPFEESCLKAVCEAAAEWISGYDLSGIE